MEISKTLRLKRPLSLAQQARLAYLFNPYKKRGADNINDVNTIKHKQDTDKAEVPQEKLFEAGWGKAKKK